MTQRVVPSRRISDQRILELLSGLAEAVDGLNRSMVEVIGALQMLDARVSELEGEGK